MAAVEYRIARPMTKDDNTPAVFRPTHTPRTRAQRKQAGCLILAFVVIVTYAVVVFVWRI